MNQEELNILADFDTPIGKIEDAGIVVRGGAIDRYWNREGLEKDVKKYFGKFPDYDWLHDSQKALEHFNLRSIEFGNWMSQQDRATFLYASMLSLHHLAHLLGIDDEQIGMKGKLSIALGARGKGKAMAHYEPNPYAVINITKTQGAGALAHEYAHAIDNIISYYTGEKRQTYVSGGRTTRKGYSENIAKNGNWFEKQFENFFNRLYFDKKGNYTEFSENLQGYEEYWHRRTEVFARTFEVYIHHQLKQSKIKDNFLVNSSYNNKAYPDQKAMLEVAPLISKITKRAFNVMKREKPLSGIATINGYKGFRKTLKEKASVEDTLINMQRIAYRDTYQVKELARELKGNNVAETTQNIWNYLRANTRYKLDTHGIEELRTPARTLVDGRAGLTDKSFGVDCDDYTILISALLLNLNIKHEYRVTAYKEKGKFQHIYPVAFDSLGNEFVIDVVPEIPHFNYEAKPIIDIKKIQMELHELSGIDDAVNTEEVKNDLLEDLNQPFSLSGIDEFEDEDELLESEFLSGFGEVDNESDAEIILNGTNDAIDLIENGLLAEINKAKQALVKERFNPTVLSQAVNVEKEIAIMNKIMRVWGNDTARANAISSAIRSGSSYANFFRAMQMSLNKIESEDLSGFDDEFSEPIYLARIDMEDFKLEHLLEEEEDLEGLGELGFFRRRRGKRRRRGGFFKRIFKGIGKGIKKVVKAVVRFNPATIVIRTAIRLVLKINLFKIASRLIYGYLTEAQAKEQGLDIGEWKKLVRAKNRTEKFYTKIGGKASKFKKAIVRGKAAKKTGLQLGAAATAGGTAAASGFIVFAKKILKAINPAKLFKKVIQKIKQKRGGQTATTDAGGQTPDFNPSNDFPMQTTSANMAMRNNETGAQEPAEQPTGFMNKIKAFFSKHKKKLVIGTVGLVVIIVAVTVYKKGQKKKKNQLRGIKAARTRARNRRRLTASTSKPRALPRPRRTPQLKGTTTRRSSTKSNGNRLKQMHRKAKELQKKHPKTKYSTLLKRASKMI